MNRFLPFLLVFGAWPLVSLNKAWGIPVVDLGCASKSNGQLRDQEAVVHNVMVIGDRDRYTDTEFAEKEGITPEKLKASTGATLKINCRGSTHIYHGAANVTIRGNVITTAAHIFEGICANERQVIPPTSCQIEVNKQVYKVKSALAQGYKCPLAQGYNSTEDWAVLELDREIPNITPYAVDFNSPESLQRGTGDVVYIGYSGDFHRQDSNGKWVNPRHIGRCKVRHYLGTYQEKYGASDCDAAGGGSGGPLLSPDLQSPKFMGIAVTVSDQLDEASAKAAEAAVKQRREFRRDYSPSIGNTGHVLVSGRLAEALRQVERAAPKKPGQISSGKSEPNSI